MMSQRHVLCTPSPRCSIKAPPPPPPPPKQGDGAAHRRAVRAARSPQATPVHHLRRPGAPFGQQRHRFVEWKPFVTGH